MKGGMSRAGIKRRHTSSFMVTVAAFLALSASLLYCLQISWLKPPRASGLELDLPTLNYKFFKSSQVKFFKFCKLFKSSIAID